MRHLLLVRHAKSSWDDDALSDRERPLAPRGVAALPTMREHLARRQTSVGLVLCSPARRAIDTLAGIRPSLPADAEVSVEDGLYGATAFDLLERLRTLDDAVRGVMVVGHNPTLQRLGELLAGSGAPAALEQLGAKFPTGAIATLGFGGEWPALDRAVAHLDDLFMPRRPRP
jgi:phosphohistidine phosphatase